MQYILWGKWAIVQKIFKNYFKINDFLKLMSFFEVCELSFKIHEHFRKIFFYIHEYFSKYGKTF